MAELKEMESDNPFLVNGGLSGLRFFHFFDHRVGELRRPRFAADIFRERLRMAIYLFQRISNLQRCVELAQMTQHQQSGSQQCGWVRKILSRNVRS